MKHCKKCNSEKALDDFYNNKSARDGKNTYCKPCWSAYMKEQDKKHKQRKAATVAAWYQRNRERKAKTSAAWKRANRDHVLHVQAQYRARNKVELMHKNAEWAIKNPHLVRANAQRSLAKRKGATIFHISMRDLVHLLTSPCAIDGCTNTDIEMDHIVPLSKGGNHGIGNLQPLCSHHNRTKHNKLMWEYRILLRRQSKRAA
jgi:5-methylcytosine-specific restriction endonuclease McrA